MATRPLAHRAWVQVAGSLLLGIAAAVVTILLGQGAMAFVVAWIVTAGTYCLWTWLQVRGMDGAETERHSQTQDPGRGTTDVALLFASLASLVGVGVLLVAGSTKQSSAYVMGALGLAAVACSWFLVHVVFMLRYARLYYGEGGRGIEIGDEEQPDYQDFAYLSFCLGMTYQVSDQTTRTRELRRTVMHHTLLSYALGAVVLACAINLVVQLASSGS